MSGPAPLYRPSFPPTFVEQAQHIVRQRTVAYQLRQRAQLVLLLQADSVLSNSRAAAEVHLHPNAVRYWRRRWALGEFCLADAPGRGRKSGFSPSGAGAGQSRGL
jgi:Homeodomain-like domain-containing protein